MATQALPLKPARGPPRAAYNRDLAERRRRREGTVEQRVRMRTRKWLAIATMLWVLAAAAPSAAQTPHLQLAATYSTGLSGDNAEVISIRSDGIAVASNTAGSVDVLDLSN